MLNDIFFLRRCSGDTVEIKWSFDDPSKWKSTDNVAIEIWSKRYTLGVSSRYYVGDVAVVPANDLTHTFTIPNPLPVPWDAVCFVVTPSSRLSVPLAT